ncbi:S-adenosylmethionine:tRNA ribosyltransferase-isomerase [Lentimicrobium sp. S6]|uniref:S-adenosylmethionine:tRNA ribosyltransferase-isomerase n=1 Tax=Lentimicrobium sp. S6 TaxID=2735872 RepID=UPI001555CAF8|nr:S-adenosylmethionine:tRNA ribosyltransferase-isomerase [Lentimicrobium sp. S6]NPD43941.1 S-adenosylmethionine:tRNA ribosyltransferase-isomerase [Lentimicrobium sp. S6]
MQRPSNIQIQEYDYPLESHRIAQYPLEERDASKLLYFNGKIQESQFKTLSSFLPENSLLVFNDTKVVQARLIFAKNTGARIEIFCLEPVEPTREIQDAFQQKSGVVWKCLIGNRKKWKSGELEMPFELTGQKNVLKAEKLKDEREYSYIRLTWTPEELDFATVLEETGKIPLPPYMDRNAEENDKIRYQTIYARNEGSVAAPTAGLHFTDAVMEKLSHKKIETHYVTLHVGAGTFKPVSDEEVGNHIMHTEQILVKKELIESLINKKDQKLIAVGTTSIRTLESLYWIGVKMIHQPNLEEYKISQWEAYELDEHIASLPSVEQSLQAIFDFLILHKLQELRSETQILIGPGYDYQMIDGMITNFHQPKSTLLLLISAYLGEQWKEIYQYAMDNDFRFLSYGDSCLFLYAED